jgi:EmrB/QacA subfamily drug resistance transporter
VSYSSRAARRSGEQAAAAAPRGRLRVAIWIISLAQLMFVLDTTIVNVALPHMQAALGFSGSGLEWIVSAYSLCFGGLLLLGGRSGDILGRRRVFVAGVAVFTTASLIGGMATAQWWLLAARACQGCGAAFASPAALALVATNFPEGRERTKAIGVFTAVGAGGGAIGLLIGGLLTTYVTWRSVFFVNVPTGVLVALIAPHVLAESARNPRRFDLLGAVTGTGAVTLAVYALISGATDSAGVSHWGDPAVLASFALAAGLFAVFVVTEARAPHALVPLHLLRQRERVGAYAIIVCVGTAMFGVFFFLTIFLQRVWNYSALHTAVVYVPPALLLTVGGPIASRLIARTGAKRLIVGGLLATAIGMIGLSRMGEHGHYATAMLAPTYVAYAGLGLINLPLITTALAGVPRGDTGVASGIFSTFRQVGGATGLAVLGTVAWSAAAAAAAAGRPHASLGGLATPAPVIRHALAVGADDGFLAAAIVIIIALVIAMATISNGQPDSRRPRRRHRG